MISTPSQIQERLSVEIDLPGDNFVSDDLHERGDEGEVVVAGDPEKFNLWIPVRIDHELDCSGAVSGGTCEAFLTTSPRTGPTSLARGGSPENVGGHH